MKHLSLWLLLLFASILVQGQSIQNLDAKYGFRQFKFGMYPSQIKNIIKNKDAANKNPTVSEYLYNGPDINYLYNVKVNQISLTFYRKRLYMISIGFGSNGHEYSDSDFNLVQYSLEKVFGEKTFNPTNESGYIVRGKIWKGKKVTLEHFKLDYSKDYPTDTIAKYHLLVLVGYIDIYQNGIQGQRLKDEF
jgi:hypothetical protein